MKSKRLLRVLTFLLCLCLLTGGLSAVLTPLYRDEKIATYDGTVVTGDLEAAARYPDVLFLGSSHVYTQLSPAILYEQEGIASYLLTGASQPFRLSLDLLEDQLSRHQPQLVVMDLYTAYGDEFRAVDEYRLLCAAQGIGSPLRRFSVLLREFGLLQGINHFFHLYNYHDSFRELQYDHWNHHSYPGKGAQPMFLTEAQEAPVPVEPGPIQLEGSSVETVQQMIRLCREKGVELVFTMLPMAHVEEMNSGTAAMRRVIEEAGGRFLESNDPLSHQQMGLDFAQDFMDDHHMNIRGQEKCSRWLAGQLKEQFGLPDRRGVPGYESWEDSLAWWNNRILAQELKTAETAYQAISKLAGADRNHLSILLTVAPGAAAEDQINGGVRDGLLSLGVTPETLYEGGIFYWDQGELLFVSSAGQGKFAGRAGELPVMAQVQAGACSAQIGADVLEHRDNMGMMVYDPLNREILYQQVCYLK